MPSKLNTCVGRIFQSTLGSGEGSDTDYFAHCPLCNELDGCRELFLAAYNDIMLNTNTTTCTRPNAAVNVTEAAKADSFLTLFVREQLLSTCNVTAKIDATGGTHTNYYARLAQHEFRNSLGTGAYCEARTLPPASSNAEYSGDAGRVRDYTVKIRADCEDPKGICGAPRRDPSTGNEIGGCKRRTGRQDCCRASSAARASGSIE